METITLKFVLQNKVLSDGTFDVALRIIKNRRKKEIALGFRCKTEEFSGQEFTRKYPKYRASNQLLSTLKTKALDIIRNYEIEAYDFTLNEFADKFRGKSKPTNYNLITFFQEQIDDLLTTGRTGNARAYKETKNALVRFAGKDTSFKSVTPEFLDKFEIFLRKNNNTEGGISFKMRELRAIFNKAINYEIISPDIYPFKNYKISKLKAKTQKRALTIEEFKKIRDVDLSNHPHLINAHKFFLFSFYARGINFVDMMKLRWSDINNGRIYYTRSKTKTQFNIEIIEGAQQILDYYKAQDRPTDYVFPILLVENLNPVQIADRKHKILVRYNAHLKEIATLAKVQHHLTSYVARHSYATILKELGTSIEVISESMGHADVQITMTYLKQFDNEVLDKENRKLMDL